MPKITRTALRNAGLRCGYGSRRADNIARRILAAPWWPQAEEQLTEGNWLPHHDPTADEAIWNVLTEILTTNTAMETAS